MKNRSKMNISLPLNSCSERKRYVLYTLPRNKTMIYHTEGRERERDETGCVTRRIIRLPITVCQCESQVYTENRPDHSHVVV